jgi:hypothetical protein
MRRPAGWWPVALAFALAGTTVLATAAAKGYPPFAPTTWARFDSHEYAEIARHGYTLFHCPPPSASDWCGNAGWFPAYPALAAVLSAVGIPLLTAALALSWLFTAATVALLWGTFLERRVSLAALGALAYAAFAPGMVYDWAIFPLSMLAFSTVAFLWLLIQGRWVAAGLAGAVAGLTYPVGALVALPAAAWLFVAPAGSDMRERGRRAAIVAGLSLSGPLLVVLVQWISLGHWNAYFLVQEKYGHDLHNPLKPILDGFDTLADGSLFQIAHAPAAQTVLVAAVLLCVLVDLGRRRRTAPRADWLIAAWAVVTWLLPHAQANLSVYRSQAALLPLALLVRRLPPVLLVAVVVVAVGLSVPMIQLFLDGKLV